MTYNAEHAAIEARLSANWTTTDINYDNVDYKPTPETPWIKLEIATGEQIPVSLGGPGATLYRNGGVISITVYVPLNSGARTAKSYCDTLAAIFRGQQFSSITCRGASITRIGEDNGWFLYNASIPYFRDEAL